MPALKYKGIEIFSRVVCWSDQLFLSFFFCGQTSRSDVTQFAQTKAWWRWCRVGSMYFSLFSGFVRQQELNHTVVTKSTSIPLRHFNGISKWRAQSKRGICIYFVANFQVARNPLKFGMLTLCVSKNVRLFFYKQGNEASNTLLKVHPPPSCPLSPPSNGVKHTHAQCFSSQWSKSYNVWRRTEGGDGFSCNLVHIVLPSK